MGMKWLLTLCIASSCFGQPDWIDLEKELREAGSVGEIVDVVDRYRIPPTVHTVTFDDRQVVTGSAVVGFDRDTSAFAYTYVGDAAVKSADEPRYAEETLVFGAPEWDMLYATGRKVIALGAGLGMSGESLAFVTIGNGDGTHTLKAYTGPSEVLSRDMHASLGVYAKPSTINDLLAGEADEEEDYCYALVSIEVFDGVAVAGCTVYRYAGTGSRSEERNWNVDGYGGCYSDDSGMSWKIRFRCEADNSNMPNGFGKPWSLNTFVINSNLWIAETNYNIGTHRSATTYLSRATKSEGVWTFEDALRFPHAIVNFKRTHAHTALFDVSGQLITFLGDGADDNRNELYTCSDLAGYLDGATLRADALHVRESGTNWTGPTIINGTITGNTEDSGQPISLAGGFIGGDEEFGPPIMSYTVPTVAGDPTQLTRGYGYSMSNHDEGNWRVFTLQSYNGGVVATTAPGKGWDTENDDATRLVYKPTGQHAWGVLAAIEGESGTSQVRPIITPDGYCIIGSLNGQGVRAIKLPTRWRSQRGLITGPGVTNYAAQTPSQRVAASGGNTVTFDAPPPEKAPCDAKIMHIVSPDGATSNNLGYQILSHDEIMSNGHTWMTIVAWVYAPEWDGSTHVNRSAQYWRCRFLTDEYGTSESHMVTGFMSPARMTHVGSWWKLEYQIENGVDWDLEFHGIKNLTIAVQMQTANSARHEQDFYIGWAGIYLDNDSPPSYAPPASTGTASAGENETAEIIGFASSNNWTVGAILRINDHGRDLLWHGSGEFRPLLTLWETDSQYIEIEWDAQSKLRITANDGFTSATKTTTNLPLAMRGDTLLFAISYDGSKYTYALSLGGSETRTDSIIPAGAVVKPIKILLGQNIDGTEHEAIDTVYAIMKDVIADDTAVLKDWVESAGR